jgi:hypothetical protein
MPPREVVLSFVEKAQTFEGSAVQRLLHQQRLARRMAKEHEQSFSPEDLLSASKLPVGRPAAGLSHRPAIRGARAMPPAEVVSRFVQQAQAFQGTPVQRLLHQQRLARRMAREHAQRFSPEALMAASRLSTLRPRAV